MGKWVLLALGSFNLKKKKKVKPPKKQDYEVNTCEKSNQVEHFASLFWELFLLPNSQSLEDYDSVKTIIVDKVISQNLTKI